MEDVTIECKNEDISRRDSVTEVTTSFSVKQVPLPLWKLTKSISFLIQIAVYKTSIAASTTFMHVVTVYIIINKIRNGKTCLIRINGS